ncbi:DNA polymerase IV [Gordonia alkaliphila]|uniref:DNA polymerase IV n=1 Tax=Gordonia alkaliphila TaxID=1053547 RepID=UPI001FF1DFDD|nr:DNA polymerase IV [Gordonia alkaliphila]MCK0438513.1 DNA polymerase IV [Gordonia alkaliphila]
MPDVERFHWLLHLDLDQFQVAAERLRRPELNEQQVIVGGDGDPTKARQVVTCGSYETRALGVRAGMPLRAAYKKAPDALYLPLDMEYYEAESAQVWATVRGVGAPTEVWGFDEGYVGFGPRDAPAPPESAALALADRLRSTVRAATGFESCLGISDNKQRAKIAAGFAKRAVRSGADGDARRFVLTDENWSDLLGPQPTTALWSVGARTAAALDEHGVSTVTELAAMPLDDLIAIFGPHKGNWLYVLARGGGDDTITVVPPPARSHSRSVTFPRDLTEPEEIRAAAHELLAQVVQQVVDEDRLPIRVGVTVRTSSFRTRTKLRKLAQPTTDSASIAPVVDELLAAFDVDRPVRLLAVRLELAPIRAK